MDPLPMAKRSGLIAALRRCRWEMVVAGSSVGYRKFIRLFDKIQMRSKVLCANQRFIYLEQGIWLRDCRAGRALYRTAATSADGVNTRNHVQKALGYYINLTKIQDWVAA